MCVCVCLCVYVFVCLCVCDGVCLWHNVFDFFFFFVFFFEVDPRSVAEVREISMENWVE